MVYVSSALRGGLCNVLDYFRLRISASESCLRWREVSDGGGARRDGVDVGVGVDVQSGVAGVGKRGGESGCVIMLERSS